MPGQILVLASMKIPLCPAHFQQQQLRAVKAAGIHQTGQLASSQSWRFDTQIRRNANTHSAVSLFTSLTFNSQNSCAERRTVLLRGDTQGASRLERGESSHGQRRGEREDPDPDGKLRTVERHHFTWTWSCDPTLCLSHTNVS